MSFGGRMKEERMRIGLSQRDLAHQVGCAKCRVSHWENGRRQARHSDLIALSRILGISIDYLLTGQRSVADTDPALPPRPPMTLPTFPDAAPDVDSFETSDAGFGLYDLEAMRALFLKRRVEIREARTEREGFADPDAARLEAEKLRQMVTDREGVIKALAAALTKAEQRPAPFEVMATRLRRVIGKIRGEAA